MKRKGSSRPAVFSAGAVFFMLVAGTPRAVLAQTYTFKQVAALGGDNPFLSYFEPGALTDFGDVVFGPDLTTGGEGVFRWRQGNLTAIAEGGQTLPGGDVLGYTLSPVSANLFGDVAFAMTRNGTSDVPSPTGLNAAVYRYNPQTGIVPVMVPGSQAHGGSVFWGSSFITAINNRRETVFPGMICTSVTNSVPTAPCPDGSPSVLALGIYKADFMGNISAVVKPGDPAPGGTFDLAHGPGLNDAGDVGFAAHVLGEPCANPAPLSCADSLYLKRASTGKIESVAHHGDPSPVPGKNYSSSFGPVLNCVGDLSFVSDLSVQGDGSDVAIFLYIGGKTIVIAKSGDTMPGGGTLATGGFYNHDAYMNNLGDVVFDGTLTNGDNGIYLWHRGILYLIAKTGTDTGFGTISTLDDFGGGVANTQLAMNDAGQILFAAKFQEGGGAILIAAPGK